MDDAPNGYKLGSHSWNQTDEVTRKRSQRELKAILESVEGKRIRRASPKQFEPCPRCQTVEHIMGHWQGNVLVLMCLKCGIQGVRTRRRTVGK